MGSPERREAGLHPTGKAHRERVYREFQRQAPAGVPGRELVHIAAGRQGEDRGLESGLQRTSAAYFSGEPDAPGICGPMGAISDREGGSFLTILLDQRRGQSHRGVGHKMRMDLSQGAGHVLINLI